MKRSYPYTGPGASTNQSPSQQNTSAAAAQSNQQTPDFSAYGYGANSAIMSSAPNGAGLSQEAQQAQWHQQWQQYYAQQAASGVSAANRPPQQQAMQDASMAQVGQPFPQYQSGPIYTQQQYGAPIPQSLPMQTPAYAWPGGQQQSNQLQPQHPSAQGYALPHMNNAPPQANYFNQGNSGPPAKRPRFGGNNQTPNAARPSPIMRPMGAPTGNMQYSPGPNGAQMPIGPQGYPNAGSPSNNANWRGNNMNAGQNAMRTGPMRGGGGPAAAVLHLGGPSNMAGPMASGPLTMRTPSASMSNPRGMNNNSRPMRPQGIPNRPSLPPTPSSQGKFNGPVGVNAFTSQGRPGTNNRSAANGLSTGPGNVMNGARRPIIGLRSGIPSGPSGKGGRFDNGKGKAVGSTASNGSKGPANANKSSGGFDMHKPPAINGKGSTLADQPVPASAKRTFSDFNIRSIQIEPISWQWHSKEGDNIEEDGDGMEEDETMQSINDTDSIGSSVVGSKKRSKHAKRKEKNELNKDNSRLRICFAANQPPPGAPTGPKALKVEEEKAEGSGGKKVKEASPSNNPEWTAFSRGPPQSSTNRISISYGLSKRRLVIDSDVVKVVEVNRAEETIKIVVDVTTAAGLKKKKQMEKRKGEEWVIVKGVLLEARESELDNFSAVSRKDLEVAWRQGAETEVNEEDVVVDDSISGVDNAVKDEKKGNGADEVKVAEVENENEEEAEESSSDDGDDDGDDDDDQEEEEDEDYKEEVDEDDDNHARQVSASDKQEAKKKTCETRAVIQDYSSLPPLYRLLIHHDGPEEDANHNAAASSELIIIVSLAEMSSKQESRWVKSGDVEEWLSALPGFHSSLTSSSGTRLRHAWSDKIIVVDPDPPPTLQDVLQDWSTKSFVGSLGERVKFLEDHQLHTYMGMIELLSKLIRGDRATPTPSIRDLGDPLKEVLGLSQFPQSHLTLSIITLIKMLQDYAKRSGEEDDILEGKMQGVIMCLPTHQIFRACDGLLKEVLEKQRLASANAVRAKVSTSGSTMGKKSGEAHAAEETKRFEPSAAEESQGGTVKEKIVKAEPDKGINGDVMSSVPLTIEKGDNVKGEDDDALSQDLLTGDAPLLNQSALDHDIKVEDEDVDLSVAAEGDTIDNNETVAVVPLEAMTTDKAVADV